MCSLRRYRELTLLLTVFLIASLLGCSGSGGSKAGPRTASSSAPSAQAVSPAQTQFLGDMDDDGEASVGDAIKILRIVVGLDPDDDCADANQNGSTDVGDAIKVLRCVVGLDDWPIGGAAQTIGPEGGTLATADGAVNLDVPSGAVQAETDITVVPQPTPPAHPGLVPGTCYEFGPDGTQFSQPAQLVIEYDEASLPAGFNEADLAIYKVTWITWQAVAGSQVDTASNLVSAPIDSFSTYAVIADDGTGPADEAIGPDGQTLIWIPGGSFAMGSEVFHASEQPVHQVTLDGYWIGKYEVTNEQYAAFLNETLPLDVTEWIRTDMTGCPISLNGQYQADAGWEQMPVTVKWEGAASYCQHYGYRLPTEARWEYAAAGPGASQYPWGDVWDVNACCNRNNLGPYGGTFPVGGVAGDESTWGVRDMAGNAGEWCWDYFDDDYYAVSPELNPTGPLAYWAWRARRGGNCGSDEPMFFRCAYRRSDAGSEGFRVAANADGSPVAAPDDGRSEPIDQMVGPDGQTLVRVPAGSFPMGSYDGYAMSDREGPVHQVTLDAFWVGRCEVTNDEYAAFLNDVRPPDHSPWIDLNPEYGCRVRLSGGQYSVEAGWGSHPVCRVTWTGAAAYCDHYGYALPTEAQWEYAARGPAARRFPWGLVWDAAKCSNVDNQGPEGATFPVASFAAGASWCGAHDMAGNLFEWCADWGDDHYYDQSPADNPTGPADGDQRIVRGGSWGNPAEECRSAYRSDWPEYFISRVIGFRVVKNTP